MAPVSEMSAPAEEVEQQKCTNKSVLCVQGDTDPGLFNPREWTRGQRRGRGAHRGPCCSSGSQSSDRGLLPGGLVQGGLGVGSRRSPPWWCCVQGPRFCAQHLRSGSWIVAFLYLVDDSLHPLAVTFRPVPQLLCICRSRCRSRYKHHKRPVSQPVSKAVNPQHKGSDEKRGCWGCCVQRPHPEGVAEQSPERSPAYWAEVRLAKQRGPQGAMPGGPGLRGGREGAGLQGGGRGNQDPVRQAFQSRALTQGLREPGQALGVPSTMFPGVIWMPGVGRSTGKGTDWRLLQTSVR